MILAILGVMALGLLLVGARVVKDRFLSPPSAHDQVLFVNTYSDPVTLTVDNGLGRTISGQNSLALKVEPGKHVASVKAMNGIQAKDVTFEVPPAGDRKLFRGMVQFGKPASTFLVRKTGAAKPVIVNPIPAEPFAVLPDDTAMVPINTAFPAVPEGESVSHVCEARKAGGHGCPEQ